MAKADDALTFSAREMQVLALAWQCFESEPKIDIKKLARITGYTEGSASVTIGKIKRKLKTLGAGGGAGESTPKKTPAAKTPAAKTPTSGKRGASVGAYETPSKKVKGERVDEDGDGDELEIKIKPEPVLHGYGAYNDFAGDF
ncbi:hypothetical protein PMIN06_006922 [Paraphaeosphaeria minitans]|uniref:Uncharacterized protein n=1 Tax=Paraphaeosphaeria minitans TaxID=565426 RepID=A0A9P6GHW1_9PLEO|nr:hypothetical protein PMIN01_06871 [Paraphaeosphaeria minitans]